MAYCEWCALDSRSDDSCEWCKRPLHQRGGGVIGTKADLDYLKVQDDDSGRGLQAIAIVGALLFSGIIIYGAYVLGRGDTPKVADKGAAVAQAGGATGEQSKGAASPPRGSSPPSVSRPRPGYVPPAYIPSARSAADEPVYRYSVKNDNSIRGDVSPTHKAAQSTTQTHLDGGNPEPITALLVYVESVELKASKNKYGQTQFDGDLVVVNQGSQPVTKAKFELYIGKEPVDLFPMRGNQIANSFDHIMPGTTSTLKVRAIVASNISLGAAKIVAMEVTIKDQHDTVKDNVQLD